MCVILFPRAKLVQADVYTMLPFEKEMSACLGPFHYLVNSTITVTGLKDAISSLTTTWAVNV